MHRTIWMEACDGGAAAIQLLKGAHSCPRLYIPHSHSVIVAARDCQTGIWRELAAADPIFVSTEGAEEVLLRN